MMLRRFTSLYERFAAAHFSFPETAGFDVAGPGGSHLGRIDGLSAHNGVLRVRGRSEARAPVELRHGATRIRGGGAQEFSLQLWIGAAAGNTPQLLFSDAAGGAVPVALHLPLRRLHARLALRFAGVFLRALPAIARWFLTGNPIWRNRVRAIFGLGTQSHTRPLDAASLAAPAAHPPDIGPPDMGVTILMPVFNAYEVMTEALDRVLRHTDLPWRLILIEDASDDPRVRPFLRDLAAAQPKGRVTLIEHAENSGFVQSVNDGFAVALGFSDPVVLLNTDALVPAGWASRLVRPLFQDPGLASVTPMSNDAEILTVPLICNRVDLRPGQARAIDAVAGRILQQAPLADVVTGVGFCMALQNAALRENPNFDTIFGRGYGEEVDWCQKTRAAGWRHVGLAGLFVEHRGGGSFGSEAKQHLVIRNNGIISARYPGYDGEVQKFIALDPLFTARMALAMAWAGSLGAGPVPVYLAHALGGGAEHWLQHRISDDLDRTGRPSVVLRVGGDWRWQLEIYTPQGMAAGATEDLGPVQTLLGLLGPHRIVYSCGVDDPDPQALPDILLALAGGQDGQPDHPVEVLFHDYFPISPSYTLLDADGWFRGAVTAANTDKAHHGRRADGTAVSLAEWQAAWGRLIAAAERITVFSEYSQALVAATWPAAADRIRVGRHELRADIQPVTQPSSPKRKVVAVLGNIGAHKGAALLCDLARHLAGPGAPELVLIGRIDPNYRLPSRVTVHGSYQIEEIGDLIRRYGITHWLIPSVWPETFSYVTHEALATGLPVLAFDIGAQGDAVLQAANGRPMRYAPGADLVDAILTALGGDRGGAA